MNISGVSCPVLLRVRRTPYVTSPPICTFKSMIYLPGRAVTSMLFHNVAAQFLIICTREVSCDGPPQHAACMVLLKVTGVLSLRSTTGPVLLQKVLSVAPRSFHRVVVFAIFRTVF
jgi:hypothetical protein